MSKAPVDHEVKVGLTADDYAWIVRRAPIEDRSNAGVIRQAIKCYRRAISSENQAAESTDEAGPAGAAVVRLATESGRGR